MQNKPIQFVKDTERKLHFDISSPEEAKAFLEPLMQKLGLEYVFPRDSLMGTFFRFRQGSHQTWTIAYLRFKNKKCGILLVGRQRDVFLKMVEQS